MSITKAMGVAATVPVKRRPTDWYSTPEEATTAFVIAELEHLAPLGPVWEMAVGDGRLARVIQRHLPVYGSDIVDRGWPGVTIKSFLDFEEPLARAGVSNPPFGSRLPERFVRHAMRLSMPYIALFLKANYFNTIQRLQLWSDWRPCAVYPLTWRPDWTGGGSPTMDMTWYVWDVRRQHQVFRPLAKPPLQPTIAAPKTLPLFANA
jgi:hypothetical protein